MKVWEKLKAFRQSRKKYIITLILLVTLVALMIYGKDTGERRMKLVYSQALDEVAVTVNGTDLTLRDVAFYVAFEEEQVEEQACEYNPEDTSEYWNVHVDGIYIRVAARNAAIQMAIHDELFYQMAMEEKISLTSEEESSCQLAYEDFWSDFTADGKAKRLGVAAEDIRNCMYRMALAQKYQSIYAQLQDVEYEQCNYGEAVYETLLKEQTYSINKDVWGRIDFGNVTLTHEKIGDGS